MNILAKIEGIKYRPSFIENLQEFNIKECDINMLPPTCLIKNINSIFAVSKWISPKRTRSYPFERVYNSLGISKKITIIPVVKDEGIEGDRDFIQWDTISLMSLLDVYVILAYYCKADKSCSNGNKVTNQKLDNDYIVKKICEIENYHSSALHWNLNELNKNISKVLEKVRDSYIDIQESTGVYLHKISGIDKIEKIIKKDVSSFMEYSRDKSKKAQEREFITIQPKEKLDSFSKSKITIKNYLGGEYYFTVDEVKLMKDTIHLIECKHSNNSLIPSKSDIKDGLLKMILYTNLTEVYVDKNKVECVPILCLTSKSLSGEISSIQKDDTIDQFIDNNRFTSRQREIIHIIFKEARENGFKIIIKQLK